MAQKSLEDLGRWEKKEQQIREKIKTLRHEHGKSYPQIKKESGWKYHPGTLWKFAESPEDFHIKNKEECKKELKKVEDFADSVIYGKIGSDDINGIPNVLYHSLLKELEIKNVNQDFILGNVLGVYRFYVGSYLMPIKFPGIVMGYMNVYHKDKCIFVDEFQKYDGRYGGQEKREENAGYMFRKSNKLYIISSQKNKGEKEDLKIAIFHKKIPSKNIKQLEGVVFGASHDFGIFNSRIVMERISDKPDKDLYEKEKENACIISVADLEKERESSEFQHYLFFEFIRKARSREDQYVIIW